MNFVPLIVCMVGGGIYGLVSDPKVSECGRIMFAFGLLVTLLNGLPKL
jgi:hypothetical protein